jgi:microcystin-dependent protein
VTLIKSDIQTLFDLISSQDILQKQSSTSIDSLTYQLTQAKSSLGATDTTIQTSLTNAITSLNNVQLPRITVLETILGDDPASTTIKTRGIWCDVDALKTKTTEFDVTVASMYTSLDSHNTSILTNSNSIAQNTTDIGLHAGRLTTLEFELGNTDASKGDIGVLQNVAAVKTMATTAYNAVNAITLRANGYSADTYPERFQVDKYFRATSGSELTVMGESFDARQRCIRMWAATNPDWAIYMSGIDSNSFSPAGKTPCRPYLLQNGTGVDAAGGITDMWGAAIRFRCSKDASYPGANGFIFENANEEALMSIHGNGHIYAPTLVPAGAMMMWTSTTSPKGFLLCDGASYSTSVFITLFAAIGYTYNTSVAVNSGVFQVPDMRGRVPVGRGDFANSDGWWYNNTTVKTLGGKGGNETMNLVEANLPVHSHGVGSYATGSAGSHTHTATTGRQNNLATGTAKSALDVAGTGTVTSGAATISTAGDHTHTMSGTSGTTGSGVGVNMMQPYVVVNYIIKI